MELDFTDEQQELRAAVRSTLSRECPPALVRAIVEQRGDAVDLWKRMVALDWPALTVPEAHGGMGLGFVELAAVIEEMGRVAAPGPFLATVTQFVPAVREAGDDEQRNRFLGAVGRGDSTGTLAVAEAAGTWDARSVLATATRAEGGWLLHGEKRYVVDGTTADEIVVAAQAPDGLGLFVVPGRDVAATALRALDASRPIATIALDGVRVGDDRRLAAAGDAAGRALTRTIEEATAALALEMLGTCQAIFEMTVEYAKVREQFGVPIGSFQAVKHKLADGLVALERARATCYFAALTIAEDDPRRGLAVAMAKSTAGDCQRAIAQEGIQIHGGIGYTWEHDLHLFVKRAKAGEPLFGSSAAHRAAVADLLDL